MMMMMFWWMIKREREKCKSSGSKTNQALFWNEAKRGSLEEKNQLGWRETKVSKKLVYCCCCCCCLESPAADDWLTCSATVALLGWRWEASPVAFDSSFLFSSLLFCWSFSGCWFSLFAPRNIRRSINRAPVIFRTYLVDGFVHGPHVHRDHDLWKAHRLQSRSDRTLTTATISASVVPVIHIVVVRWQAIRIVVT